MSTLPRQIAALMPEADGTLPEDIAKLSGALLAKIDTGIEPTQLAGVMSLRKEDLPKATTSPAATEPPSDNTSRPSAQADRAAPKETKKNFKDDKKNHRK